MIEKFHGKIEKKIICVMCVHIYNLELSDFLPLRFNVKSIFKIPEVPKTKFRASEAAKMAVFELTKSS